MLYQTFLKLEYAVRSVARRHSSLWQLTSVWFENRSKEEQSKSAGGPFP